MRYVISWHVYRSIPPFFFSSVSESDRGTKKDFFSAKRLNVYSSAYSIIIKTINFPVAFDLKWGNKKSNSYELANALKKKKVFISVNGFLFELIDIERFVVGWCCCASVWIYLRRANIDMNMNT